MRVLHSSRPFDETEISGTDVEWTGLALAMRRDGAELDCEHVAAPAPYERCLANARIQHSPGKKVRIRATANGMLIIEGDPAFLAHLAETMAIVGGQFRPGEHIHIDHQGDDHFIDRGSSSVVLARLGKLG